MRIEREIIDKLKQWKDSPDRSPLIIQGARQIGKSWAVAEFGRLYFKHIAIFNFDRHTELHSLFAKTKDTRRIIAELELYTDVPIIAGETLIFFDEIQDCKEALNALKYFKEDAPQYHIIAAGSLLGVATQRIVKLDSNKGNTFPVGKVTFMDMYPVTFREYLRVADEKLKRYVDEHIKDLEPLPEIVFEQIALHYRRYQTCGGLPLPCSHMLAGKGISVVEEDLEDLLRSYEFDFTKHVEAQDIPRIREIWRSLPSQLSRENKKFIFRVVREGARAREYESALDWLVLSGMVYRIYCCETPILPLKHYEDLTAFKVYVVDQALLRHMAQLPPEVILAKDDLLREFKGAMAENYVLGALLAQGVKMPHYWTLKGNKAEVDFLITHGLKIVPIEVKADVNVNGKSFAEYDKKYSPELRLRLSMRNVQKIGNLVNIPLFLVDWLRDILDGTELVKSHSIGE